MQISSRPNRKPGFHLEAIDNELLLFHPVQTTVMYCSETASLIWRLCDGQRTVEEIAALLVDAFPEAAEEIPGDVEAALEQFLRHGAIELA